MTHEEQIEELEGEIQDLKIEIIDLKNEVAEKEDQIHELDEQVTALESQLNDKENPDFGSLVENMKYEYFMEHFDKFTQEQLEQIVSK